MKKILMVAAALAVALVAGACSSPTMPAQLKTPQGQAAALGEVYAGAKMLFAVYAVSPAADPAVVAAVTKAQTVADPAIAKAQADILAAPDQTAMQTAVAAGSDALSILTKALVTYGVVTPALVPASAAAPAG